MGPGRVFLAAALWALLPGCSEGKIGVKEASGDQELDSTKSSPSTNGDHHFQYPPDERGPHEGFDLAALRNKLQGTWLVSGNAFRHVPDIWHVHGDEVTIVDAKGERFENTIELLSPCSAEVRSIAGTLAVEHQFVFAGKTLYLGMSGAGLVQGKVTIGCTPSGNYVYDRALCTKWTMNARPPPGESRWSSEPGDCGYKEGGDVFFGDDTKSKQSMYGEERLNLRGKVLLTLQTEGSKARRVASFDEALAIQGELIDKRTALERPPADLAFASWDLGTTEVPYLANESVWAAGVNRDGAWSFNLFRYNKAEKDVLELQSVSRIWAPSAFVQAAEPATDLVKGAPVMVAGPAFVSYCRVAEMRGDKVLVETLSATKARAREVPANRVRAIHAGEWALGAPAAYKDGDSWASAQVVLDQGDKAYVTTSKGVMQKDKSELRLIDLSVPLAKGTKVLAERVSGKPPLRFVSGKIAEVHGDGCAYTIQPDQGRTFMQSYDKVMKK